LKKHVERVHPTKFKNYSDAKVKYTVDETIKTITYEIGGARESNKIEKVE